MLVQPWLLLLPLLLRHLPMWAAMTWALQWQLLQLLQQACLG
jgi:hypothetical protein